MTQNLSAITGIDFAGLNGLSDKLIKVAKIVVWGRGR